MIDFNHNFNRNMNMNTSMNHNSDYLVFEQRTEHDKNLSTLAQAQAECLMSLYSYKTCKKENCASCEKHEMLQKCLNELAICDQLKVNSLADNIYTHAAASHKIVRDRHVKTNIGIIGLLILFVGGGVVCFIIGLLMHLKVIK